jgi:hypothetical protein
MKRSFTLQSVIGICMMVLVLSCHKRGDFEVPCKLLKMSYVERGAFPETREEYTGIFTYNSWGDPTKIIWDVTATGRPNYFFTYDNKRRLTWFEGSYVAQQFEQITRYIYEGDRIVGDSSWALGNDRNNFRATAWAKDVSTYQYDMKGRIIRVDTKDLNWGSTYTMTFEYDAAGNLVRDGANYDNKKSYLRTNAWLMFVTRDFSVNNPQVADAYNKKGLPLTYQNTTLTFRNNSLVNEFEYSCDHKNH